MGATRKRLKQTGGRVIVTNSDENRQAVTDQLQQSERAMSGVVVPAKKARKEG